MAEHRIRSNMESTGCHILCLNCRTQANLGDKIANIMEMTGRDNDLDREKGENQLLLEHEFQGSRRKKSLPYLQPL